MLIFREKIEKIIILLKCRTVNYIILHQRVILKGDKNSRHIASHGDEKR